MNVGAITSSRPAGSAQAAATPAAPAPQPPEDPSHGAFSKYAHDITRMPGLAWVGWQIDEPGVLHAYYGNADLARLTSNVLRDTIDGATLSVRLYKNHAFKPAAQEDDTAWYNEGINMLRAVAGLPGVKDYAMVSSTTATFVTTTAAVAEHLQHIVRDQLGDITVKFSPYDPDPGGTATGPAATPDPAVTVA